PAMMSLLIAPIANEESANTQSVPTQISWNRSSSMAIWRQLLQQFQHHCAIKHDAAHQRHPVPVRGTKCET
ncbi:hypothetical protein, partial [Bradyrhizobium sp. 139]|uniref:hypothetical protein n=1 Tax=Bradyrhizobium sp. 139 TaxID=2782616 RepID=UPI001FF7CFDB